jgi:hypothetical protein
MANRGLTIKDMINSKKYYYQKTTEQQKKRWKELKEKLTLLKIQCGKEKRDKVAK